jgi:hypothetical protein
VLGRRRARARRASNGGGGMAAAMARAARCSAQGEAGGLYTRLGRPVGDARVTAEMRPFYGGSRRARTAATRQRTAGPWRVRAYGGAYLEAPQDGALRGARASGRGVARTSRPRAARARAPGQAGGGRRRRRTGRARRRARRARALAVLLVHVLNRFFSKFSNRTGPRDEYKSCRSRYQLRLLQRLYRVLLPRFESVGVPTLNVSLCLPTVISGLQGLFHNFPLQICNATLHESCVPQQDLQLSQR